MKSKIIVTGILMMAASAAKAEECTWNGHYCYTNHLMFAAAEAPTKSAAAALGSRFLFSSRAGDPVETQGLDKAAADRGIARLNWHLVPAGQFRTSVKSAVQDEKPWDTAYRALLSREENAFKSAGMTPVIAEPEIVYHNRQFEEKYRELEERGVLSPAAVDAAGLEEKAQEAVTASVVKQPKKVWPWGAPGWHLGEEYTNLRAAIEEVGDVAPDRRVTIAHLDTGYDAKDRLLPKYFDTEASRDFTSDDPDKPYIGKPQKKPLHGARTLATLAGNDVRIVESGKPLFEGTVGGNPYARVFEYRIGNSVVHLRPSAMSAAIARAVQAKADVITLSAGGLPSVAQRNAVNKAYDAGTAIFAATGDFFVMPFTSFTLTPSTVAFPARFNRVMGVAGVTRDRKSYGKAPCRWCLAKFWQWSRNLRPWTFRGSYGPASVMKNNVVAAYSPNILHSWPSTASASAVGLDGAGTSHPTPQVAAAASLWLQKNRDVLEKQNAWDNWKKAEADYQAIIRSSEKPDAYSMKTMGEGVLNAERLLDVEIDPKTLQPRPLATIGVRWIWDLVRSWDLVKWIPDALLRRAIEEMLVTEIQQVIYESKRGQKLLDEQTECDERNADEAVTACREEVAEQFENILLRNDLGSEFLKATIRERLGEWIERNIQRRLL